VGGRIDWFVIALDAGQHELAALGSAGAPFALFRLPAERRWYRRGWVWATIAASAVAVGAATGLGVYFGERTTPPVFLVPTR
jgi:hypothetical protein